MREILLLTLCAAACDGAPNNVLADGGGAGSDAALPSDGAVDGPATARGDAGAGEDGSVAGGPLIDGPPGSQIPGWSAQDPSPVLLLAHRIQPAAWLLAIANIGADGTLSGLTNVDRVRGFGFAAASAPTLVYDGPIGGASVAGWKASAPSAVLVMARRTGQMTWVLSLASIDAAGTLSGPVNVDRVRVWRFTAAPAVSGAVPGAKIPGWSATSPGPFLLAASQSASSTWFVGTGSVADDGTIGDVAANQVMAWTL